MSFFIAISAGVVNVLVSELATRRDVVLWGIDLKAGMELAPWGPVLARLATTAGEALELLRAANRVLDVRARTLAGRRERSWRPGPAAPLLVVLVDELAELAAAGDRVMDLVERVARLVRAPGVQLVMSTQLPTALALGSLDARSQAGIRIAGRVAEARDADLVLGQGRMSSGWAAHRLGQPGSILVLSDVHQRPRPARAYLVTDDRVRELADRLGAKRPSLDPASAEAAAAASEGKRPTDRPDSAGIDPGLSRGLEDADVAGDVLELRPRGGRPTAAERVAALVAAAAGDGMTAGELVAALEGAVSRTQTFDALRRLTGAGRIVQRADGRCVAVAGGEDH